MAAPSLSLNVERWTLNVGRFLQTRKQSGCALSLCVILVFAATRSGFAENVEAAGTFQNYLDSLAAENRLPGAILIVKNGIPIASKAAGIANRATGAPNTLETKFNLGSLNKMFTSVAIAQLAQKGRLNFDDTISKHLPDYPNKEVAEKVTIHQLLTHTSGMGSYTNDKFPALRSQMLTVAAHLPLFVNEPLSFAPGEKFQYSNSAYMLLGAMVEKLAGQDYYDSSATTFSSPRA